MLLMYDYEVILEPYYMYIEPPWQPLEIFLAAAILFLLTLINILIIVFQNETMKDANPYFS